METEELERAARPFRALTSYHVVPRSEQEIPAVGTSAKAKPIQKMAAPSSTERHYVQMIQEESSSHRERRAMANSRGSVSPFSANTFRSLSAGRSSLSHIEKCFDEDSYHRMPLPRSRDTNYLPPGAPSPHTNRRSSNAPMNGMSRVPGTPSTVRISR